MITSSHFLQCQEIRTSDTCRLQDSSELRNLVLNPDNKMVVHLKTVWVAATCLFLALSMVCGRLPLVPARNSRRFFTKFREYPTSGRTSSKGEDSRRLFTKFREYPTSGGGTSLKDHDNFVHDGPVDNQANDIAYLFPFTQYAPRTVKFNHRSMTTSPCLPRLKRTRPLSDALRIGSISFPIDTRKEYGDWNRSVHADCAFLVGLSDFKQIALDRPQEYLLSWYKLKTSCSVSSSINGMRDGKGEAEVHVGPLRMLVRMPKSEELGSPELRMSEVRDVRVTIRDSEGFPNDFSRKVSAEIEKTILCIVNSDVRNILMDSMKCLRIGETSSCKLTDGYRTM